jgi:hypothetical protein
VAEINAMAIAMIMENMNKCPYNENRGILML